MIEYSILGGASICPAFKAGAGQSSSEKKIYKKWSDSECIEECRERQKKKDTSISRVTILQNGNACWCEKMSTPKTSAAKVKICFLETSENSHILYPISFEMLSCHILGSAEVVKSCELYRYVITVKTRQLLSMVPSWQYSPTSSQDLPCQL